MYNPSDVSHDTIKNLFYQQIRRVTKRACGNESFDIQFSDQWL
jgi:hypothetical protein